MNAMGGAAAFGLIVSTDALYQIFAQISDMEVVEQSAALDALNVKGMTTAHVKREFRKFQNRRAKVLADRAAADAKAKGGQSDPKSLPGLALDGNGRWPLWTYDNVGIVLEDHDDWRGALAHDEFAGATMLMRPIPGTAVASFRPGPLTDADVTEAVRWFAKKFYPRASRPMVQDVMLQVARRTVLSPVRDYLSALRWDGQGRLDGWLTDYLGAAATPLVSEIGRRWLISAVARAREPGCKADCVLVLEGPQGALKSSALRTLASDAWFHDGLPDLHSKDAAAALRGKWIIELAELTAMRKSDVEAAKAFISRQVERFRPAYGRLEVTEPRRCVFAASTNAETYLQDATGNRRFWPVAVGVIDLPALGRDRDQLWAEARAAFEADERWWLDPQMEAEAAVETSRRVEEDPWAAPIAALLAHASETTTRECLQVVGVMPDKQTQAMAKRVGAVLRGLGWENAGIIASGPNRNLRRWVRRSASECVDASDASDASEFHESLRSI